MTNKSINTLAVGAAVLVISVAVASSVEEYDRLAGQTGAALESANNNEIYRGVLADFRYYFTEEFQKEMKEQYPSHAELLRQTKSTGKKKRGSDDEEGVTYAEAEGAYMKRALAVLASIKNVPEVPITDFQYIADRVMAQPELDAAGNPVLEDVLDDSGQPTGEKKPKLLIRFDPSRAERGERGPKTLPKIYVRAAEQLWSNGKADGFIAHYKLTVTPAEDADEAAIKALKIDAIARKIKSLEDAERAKEDLANKYAVPEAA